MLKLVSEALKAKVEKDNMQNISQMKVYEKSITFMICEAAIQGNMSIYLTTF